MKARVFRQELDFSASQTTTSVDAQLPSGRHLQATRSATSLKGSLRRQSISFDELRPDRVALGDDVSTDDEDDNRPLPPAPPRRRKSISEGVQTSIDHQRPQPPRPEAPFEEKLPWLMDPDTKKRPGDPGYKHEIPSRVGSFELDTEFTVDFGDIRIARWTSKVTGLKVTWANVPGPLVKGYFAVATEIWNDSGEPHTLEHLTFMGSKQYPYKGFLDVIGNRLIADGTNAETATDHTMYTCATASADGFLDLLPVYLDHVFFPTLTDEAFTTEVYHMTGKGEDAGVVLAEMQGSQDDPYDLMRLLAERTLYNKDNAQRSETGGLVENLRKLTIDEIRDYHEATYVPHNANIIVLGGSLAPASLLDALHRRVEPTLVTAGFNQGPHPQGWYRPFVATSTAANPPIIESSVVKEVEFPSDDESVGHVNVTWVGPPANAFLESTAMGVLAQYLCDSAIGPLQKALIQIPQPWCGDVEWSPSGGGDPSIVSATFPSVVSSKLHDIQPRLLSILKHIVKDGIDMSRIDTILDSQIQSIHNIGENSPFDLLKEGILSDFLYCADDGSELQSQFQLVGDLQRLTKWKVEDWADLITHWYIEAPSLTIVGVPSAALVKSLAAKRKAWVAGNVARVGPAGLKKLDKIVQDAEAANARKIPPKLISQWLVPSVANIHFVSVESARSHGAAEVKNVSGMGRLQAHIDDEGGADLPIYVQYAHYPSSFLDISVNLTPTTNLPQRILDLVPLYISTFFELPVTRKSGRKLAYQEVVLELSKDLLDRQIDFQHGFDMLEVTCRLPFDKYGVGIEWLADLLYGSTFDVARLNVCVAQLLQGLAADRKDFSGVSSSGLGTMITSRKSIKSSSKLFARLETLPKLKERLDQEPGKVVADLETLRHALLDPRYMRASVTGKVLALKNPASAWLDHFEELPSSQVVEKSLPLRRASEFRTFLAEHPAYILNIYATPGSESTYSHFATSAPDNVDHKDYPAMLVAVQILNATEGPLWDAVRGAGLAYGANLAHSLDHGLLIYILFKSPSVTAAWKASRELFRAIATGKTAVTELQLAAAKSGYAFGVACQLSTQRAAAAQSFYNQVLLDRPQDFDHILLERVERVTLKQVLSVFRTYFLGLFDASQSIGVIAAGPAKVRDTAEAFQKLGYDVKQLEVA